MEIGLVQDRYTNILNMNLNNMAEYFGGKLKVCCYEGKTKLCPLVGDCVSCWRKFLQEVEK